MSVDDWVWDHAPKDMQPSEMLVALVLANNAERYSGHTFLMRSQICELTHLSPRSVTYAIGSLIARGMVERVAEATGRRQAIYRFAHCSGLTDEDGAPLTLRLVSRNRAQPLLRIDESTDNRAQPLQPIPEIGRNHCTSTDSTQCPDTPPIYKEVNNDVTSIENVVGSRELSGLEYAKTQTQNFDGNASETGSGGERTQCTGTGFSGIEKKEEKQAKEEKRTTSADTFSLDAEDRQYAIDRGWNESRVAAEYENLRDYFLAKGERRIDWHATWRWWVRNGIKWETERKAKEATRNGKGSQYKWSGL